MKAKTLMEKKWCQVLEEELEKPYMKLIQAFLAEERAKGKVVYPPEDLIFNAFCHTSFDKVNVVIVGQDPYHGPGQAQGLSFSVQDGIKKPPSLKNIYKELVEDVGIRMPTSGCLIPWARQGVLLLNATLTVEASSPRSHYGKGWEAFTDKVIEKLAMKKDPIVFLLWGKFAQEKCFNVFNSFDSLSHLVLIAPHPSPYSASSGFFCCRHFSKANNFLEKNGKKKINWQIE
jgi:uracil-DNA glycosylase